MRSGIDGEGSVPYFGGFGLVEENGQNDILDLVSRVKGISLDIVTCHFDGCAFDKVYPRRLGYFRKNTIFKTMR